MEVELVHQHVRKGGNIQVANGGANCNVDMCRAYIFDTEWETLRIFGPELFTTNTAGNGTPESRCFQKKAKDFATVHACLLPQYLLPLPQDLLPQDACLLPQDQRTLLRRWHGFG